MEHKKVSSLLRSYASSIKTFSFLTVLNFLLMGLGFLTRVKIVNALGKSDYGLFSYGLALGAFFSILVQYGVIRTFVRDLIHFPERVPELVAGSFLLRIIILFLAIIVLIFWKLSGFACQGIPWSPFFVSIAVCIVSLNMQPYFDVHKQMERAAIYNFSQRCIYFGLVWFTIIFFPNQFNINLLAFFLFISGIIYLIMQYRWICPRIFHNSNLNWGDIASQIKWILRKNISIFLASVGAFFVLYLNQLMLQHIKGAAELGEYAAVWLIVNLSTSMLSQVNRIGMPQMATVTKNSNQARVQISFLIKYTIIMLSLASIVAIPVFLFPKEILELLFTHEYFSATTIMKIAAVYMLIYAFASVYSQYLISVHLENWYCINVIVGGFVNIILAYVLIKRYGSVGAAFSIVIAHLIVSVLNFSIAARHLKGVRHHA